MTARCARLLVFNVRTGWHILLPALCAVALTTIFALFSSLVRIRFAQMSLASLSFADNLCIVLSGQPPFFHRSGVSFIPPLGWVFLLAAMMFAGLGNVTVRQSVLGERALLACASRRLWWFTRCAYSLCCVLACWAVLLVTTALWTLCWGQVFSADVSAALLVTFQVASDNLAGSSAPCTGFLAGAVLASLACTLLQLLVLTVTRADFAFLLSMAQLVFASYLQSPLLVANLCMATRWEGLVLDGVPYGQTLAVAAAMALLSYVLGAWRIKRADIIMGSEDS